ncbi:orotidine-5'-phosphate decarboxylase [Desulfobacca acetoxidans]|uniref:Orotidine 5'-phosphate decarboxylase n=1 Tax=Desulfobacca acetoxidans (strain ATCC 700848 / DSM 11109 / ASRB2) TaxID=880072 RepID=F2NEH8_DESAR|nr:orotidine-5'-phosphate decarboxylase [Desulfobacca acetoxidans]AEB08168.1 orotidine 5'-phosphate decarboxylase [Desulfobacca acetoxidans DSM 11109]
MEAKKRLIFPLDAPDGKQARQLIRLLQNEVGLFKVGLELFVAEGPQFFRTMAAEAGTDFFLDLKFHDIPETMSRALKNLFSGVALTTIHCDQGARLLRAVQETQDRGINVLGVTVLTSIDGKDLLAAGIDPRYANPPRELVLLRAGLAKAAGCSGVVCSGQEAQVVKERFGSDFIVVCPGIRPEWSVAPEDDQKRIMTPSEAIKAGADYIVVGRPIRLAADSVAAARMVVAEIAAALQ